MAEILALTCKPESTAESSRNQSSLMNGKEFGLFNFLKLENRRGDQIIQQFCRIGCSQEIGSPLLNFKKFSKYEKSTVESCRNQSNLMNDEEFPSFNFLKLKYRRAE